MERTYCALSLDYEMHWHCEDNFHIWLILFVWEFCDEMFRYCEDNTYIIVIVTYGWYIWSYGVHSIVPEKTLVISMRTTLCWEDFGLHCGLAITVVERLERYNCIWLTLTMSNRTFYSPLRLEAVRCYLYVESWFGECFVFRRRLYRYLLVSAVLSSSVG